MRRTVVLSADCTGELLYPKPFGISNYTTTDCDKDDAVEKCLTFTSDVEGGTSMHHGGNNVLFGDGHVAWFKTFEPRAITFHPSRMQAWEDVTAE